MKNSLFVAMIVTVFVVLCSVTIPNTLADDVGSRSIERTVVVTGETWQVRCVVTSQPHSAEIRVLRVGVGATDSSVTLATVKALTVEPDEIDFAVAPSGKVLWLLLAEKNIHQGGVVHRVYPFLRTQGSQAEAFAKVTYRKQIKKDGRLEEKDITSSLSISHVLRRIAQAKAMKGEGLTLGRGVYITDVQVKCEEGDAAIVTGRLGDQYTFSGRVSLSNDQRISANDFEIVSTKEEVGRLENREKKGNAHSPYAEEQDQ